MDTDMNEQLKEIRNLVDILKERAVQHEIVSKKYEVMGHLNDAKIYHGRSIESKSIAGEMEFRFLK